MELGAPFFHEVLIGIRNSLTPEAMKYTGKELGGEIRASLWRVDDSRGYLRYEKFSLENTMS